MHFLCLHGMGSNSKVCIFVCVSSSLIVAFWCIAESIPMYCYWCYHSSFPAIPLVPFPFCLSPISLSHRLSEVRFRRPLQASTYCRFNRKVFSFHRYSRCRPVLYILSAPTLPASTILNTLNPTLRVWGRFTEGQPEPPAALRYALGSGHTYDFMEGLIPCPAAPGKHNTIPFFQSEGAGGGALSAARSKGRFKAK